MKKILIFPTGYVPGALRNVLVCMGATEYRKENWRSGKFVDWLESIAIPAELEDVEKLAIENPDNLYKIYETTNHGRKETTYVGCLCFRQDDGGVLAVANVVELPDDAVFYISRDLSSRREKINVLKLVNAEIGMYENDL